MQGQSTDSMSVKQRAVQERAWGISSSIDIYDCTPATIRDPEAIARFVAELCELIGMKRYQETVVVHFGEEERTAGFSMVQFIETSLISAHFANLTNVAYLDLFSCRPYDPEAVADFAKRFFGGRKVIIHATLRY